MELLGRVHRNRLRRCLVFRVLRAITLSLALAWVPSAASALDEGQMEIAEGLAVYLGIIPAEIVRGHSQPHPEAEMHGGPPRGEHESHVVVAVFDNASGDRIADAKITARVSQLGLVGPEKPLEPMKIAGTITFGNYFDLPDKGIYTIDLKIERPAGTVRVKFVSEH